MNFYVKFLLLYLAVDWTIPKVLAFGPEEARYAPLIDTILNPRDASSTGIAISFAQVVPVLLVTWVLARFVF